MNDKRSTVRMRYTGKTGYHGLRHGKVYAVSIVSMYGKFWVEVGDATRYKRYFVKEAAKRVGSL